MIEYHGIKLGAMNEKAFQIAYTIYEKDSLMPYEKFVDSYRRFIANDCNKALCFGYIDTVIGVGKLINIDRLNSHAEISLDITENQLEHWDNCFEALAKYCFEDENLNSIYLRLKFDNNLDDHLNTKTCLVSSLPERLWRKDEYINMIEYTFLRDQWNKE